MRVDDCYCGVATRQAGVIVIQDFRHAPPGLDLNCQREGFASVACSASCARRGAGLVFAAFPQPAQARACRIAAARNAGPALGVALDNRRLSAQARQLAVVQERGLVAQGLHDSLAQGLNFLNLQLQMLDGAVKRGDAAEVEEILPLLRTGVDESYQDVRELLTNSAASCRRAIYTWRSRTPWTASAARPAWIPSWQWASARARRWRRTSSCRCCSSCRRRCRTCASTPRPRVRVEVEDGRDFVLDISDDGQGYDAEEVAARGEAHVGLHIMRERAARMRAVIKLESRPGQGTRVL